MNLTHSKLPIYTVIGAIIALIIALVNNYHKKLTTNLYVTNMYIYIMLGILLTALTVLLMEIMKFNSNNFNMSYQICTFLIALLIICTFAFTSIQNVLFRHVLFTLFAIVIGIMTFPIYQDSIKSGIFYKSIASVFVVILGLTFVANQYPTNYFDGWGPVLTFSLLSLIIFELFDMIFVSNIVESRRIKMYAMVGTALFSAFIVYDTKKIYQYADQAINCTNSGGDIMVCSDYPQKSLDMYLDIINLFTNVTQLQN